jgi:hypothetical protein
MVEEVNGGDNSTNSKNTSPTKAHYPHPWMDGTQLG